MKIEIKVKKDGTIEAKTEGETGKKCLHIVPFLDELIEGRVIDYKLLDAFYKQSSNEELVEKDKINDLEEDRTKTLSKCHTGV